MWAAWLGVAAAAELTVSISGGGSLGMYQAGALFYLGAALREDAERSRVVSLSGTSSGSMNATFFAFDPALRQDTLPDPQSSLLYRAWARVGYDALTDAGPLSPQGFFDRRAFDETITELSDTWAAGWPAGESMVWTTAVSRIKPREVLLGDGLSAPHNVEYLATRIEGRGAGRPLKATPMIDPRVGYAQPYLPLQGDDIGMMIDASLASAAFPMLFPPVTLPLCYAVADQPLAPCEAPEEVTLVDGGLYDNQPLRAAMRLRPDEERDIEHVFIDARLGAFPTPETVDGREPSQSAQLVTALVGGLVANAASRPLVIALEEDPTLRERLHAFPAPLPQASGDLFGFLGLFQSELRRFDFYLGMLSVHRALDGSGIADPLDIPEDVGGWAPLLCLDAALGDRESPACEHPESVALAPVMQVAIERQYAWCEAAPEAQLSAPSWHCIAARDGSPPPVVPGLPTTVGDDWRLRPGEALLDHAIRRYAHHGLIWTDLGLKRPSVRPVHRKLRRALLHGWFCVARATPGPSIGIRLTGRAAIRALMP